MMKRSVLLILTLLVLSLSIINVSAFTMDAGNANSTCAGSTVVITDIVKGTGTFTVSTSGTAKSFSTIVPSGFSLQDGSQYIYSYVTPTSTTSPGTYDLIVKAVSSEGEKNAIHSITVNDCHSSDLALSPQTVETCPCSQVILAASLTNSGKYIESFQLSIEGQLKDSATLSDSVLSLNPGEVKNFKVYVNTSCTYGKYDLTVKAKSTTSKTIKEAKAVIDAKPCYEYTISVPQNYYSICEHSSLNIPLTVRNDGTAKNNINFNLKGPGFAALNKNELELSSGSSDILNLTVNPNFEETGNFTLLIEAMTDLGYVKKSQEVNIGVDKCYGVFMSIDKDNDKICNGLSGEYDVLIKNTGRFNNTYNLDVKAPEWVSVDKSVSLDANSEQTLKITVNPAENSQSGTYEVKIRAIDPVSNVYSEDSLELTTLTVDDCYKAIINSEKDSIDVSPDSSATLLLTLKNDGIKNASYIIDISGTASSFVLINPGIVSMEPGKGESLYLYIAPSVDLKESVYDVTVSARLKDTNIVSNKKISINVTALAVAEAKNETQVETVEKESKGFFSSISDWFVGIFSSIGKFFTGLFTIETPQINETLSNETITNETAENITISEALIETIEVGNLTITENETQANESVNESEIILVNVTENETSENITLIENETIETNQASIANITETNETIEINITNETIEIVQNETNITESLISSLNETSNQTIENITSENITEAENETAAEKTSMKDIIIENKTYIIGAIIIVLLVLLFSTGLWKKIIDFFEEDSE
jgi:uncharacterized membrane protein